ncbi:MAG: AraC family transcriptional regulator [Saprospiraceae bacterium]|nr:AraC family transcriptional regulator [Saprospiraceae bacterium]MCF8250395.1 AraC family transcriptional regulator [Saprospiraceae bacterium]MCF8281535.1 AraC family transcriptional regulator [Bacteroidales bacterium]MCF8312230.1 AraC family transcriptional regulator [Saprospiraceae bacterium]MCF8440571.1 AraC family transcriptional regulator [Saprospiraceae bacterium]
MRIGKPIFENIQPSFGSSFTYRQFTEENCSSLPYWHCHPEYEIVFISNGRGKRQIAEHISYYEDGDLIFLGPNIPHLGFAQELYESHQEIVVQMRSDFLGNDFLTKPEMAAVQQLFERAKSGVTFHGHTRWEVGQMLGRMSEMDNFYRMVELLRILQIMATTQEFVPLNINQISAEVKPQDHFRMKKVFEFMEENFYRQFLQDEVAQHINMTTPAFCRFFKKLNHKVFTDFLNEYRVARACNLLSGESKSISSACFDSGFNNLSHFNKQFKQVTGQTPSDYRRNLRNFVLSPI